MSLGSIDSPLASVSASPANTGADTAQQAPVVPNLRAQIVLLLAITVLVYANSLFNGFTMDDELYILRNPQVTQHSLKLLLQPNAASNVFRPFTFASLALNWIVAGYKPFGYHLLNLALHAAVVLLLLCILREVLRRVRLGEFISFAAALLFAVHPIHIEAVSSIVGRSELLAAGFLLTAWLSHLGDRNVLCFASFALALLSKESAVCLLPLVFAGDYATGKWKPWWRYTGIAFLTTVYIGVLWKVQGGHFGAGSVAVLDNPLTMLPPGLRILNAIRIAWKYVWVLVFPATLSCDYSYNQIPLYANLSHLLFPVLSAAGVIGLWVWAIVKRSSGFVVAGAIYFAGFAITSNVIMRTGTIFGERLAYLPSAGFCLLIALLLAWVLEPWVLERSRAAGLAVLTLLVVGLGLRAAVRNRDWRDNASLYTAAADAVPNSAKMRAFRGIVYLGRNELDRARSDLQAALQITPDYPDAIEALGLLELRLGNRQAALTKFQQALQLSPLSDFDYDYRAANLSGLQIAMGKLDDALKLLNRRIAESPNYSRLWSNRAALHAQLGHSQQAADDAQTALHLDPNDAEARRVLQYVHSANGQ